MVKRKPNTHRESLLAELENPATQGVRVRRPYSPETFLVLATAQKIHHCTILSCNSGTLQCGLQVWPRGGKKARQQGEEEDGTEEVRLLRTS